MWKELPEKWFETYDAFNKQLSQKHVTYIMLFG